MFSPQNWIKTKGCLSNINMAVRNYFNMLNVMPGGAEIKKKLNEEIAFSIGVAVGTVKSRLTRARQALRLELREARPA